MKQRRSRALPRIITGAVILVLAIAMVLSTKVLSAAEVAALNPAPFSAEAYAKEQLPVITTYVEANAKDLPAVVTAVEADENAAGETLGKKAPGASNAVIPVKTTGSVVEVNANFVKLKVEGVADSNTVYVAIGQSLQGTAYRDATGEVQFGDFANQTDYQAAANSLKTTVLGSVVTPLKSAQPGQTVTVSGLYIAGFGADATYIIHPVAATVS
ncbi:DUF2291 family protein [Micrococcales bacterium 31B]|nr:DUF2291 family protein [Micrococcales bacterium 31B]